MRVAVVPYSVRTFQGQRKRYKIQTKKRDGAKQAVVIARLHKQIIYRTDGIQKSTCEYYKSRPLLFSLVFDLIRSNLF